MTGQPYISVIVTAYNRRRYLPFALRSLEAQTLPRDKFEVIVVKNFDDKGSDDIISRNGWKDLYEDSTYHGRKILVGLEESKGDVITFLEDDDMYASNRLEEVYKAFTSYDRLVYFHNSQTIIDGNGNLLERPPPSLPTPKNLIGGSTIVIDIDRLRRFTKRYNMSVIDLALKVRAYAWHNSSSLAVRRGVLEAEAHLLRELPMAFDAFALASSLRAGGLMYFTDERLTLFRVHGENWSLMSVAKGSKEEMRLRRARYILSEISACRLIGSRLLNDEAIICLCMEEGDKRVLLTSPLPELGTLPPELRINISNVKLALRCYKVGYYKILADLAFVMGHLFLSPILASPRGRLVVGKLLESIRRQS
ncbi:MAG: glycosyltransferase family 2 protein [Acidilobus sp.]